MGTKDSPAKEKLGSSCALCGAASCACIATADEASPAPRSKPCQWCRQVICVCPAIEKDRKDDSKSSEDPLIGQVIGQNYQVLEIIGRGGMGTVYKVQHRTLRKLYALKMLTRKQGITKKALKRFEIEARAASGLNHPNLVTVFDYGSAAQGPFIIMQLAEGRPLSDYIKFDQLLSEENTLDIFLQLCEALLHAHSRRVLHRDIKPGNIMIDESSGKPIARLLDFGVAKMLPEEDEASGGITQTGEVVGSPKYMSPEQCLGNKQDRRSDIYSLGCVMYEALTGRAPFDGENAVQIYFSQINNRAPLFKESCQKHIRPEIERVVLQCLEKDPSLRYQLAEDLRADILLLKAGKNPRVKGISTYRRRVRSVATSAAWVLGTASLIAVSAFGYQWLREAQQPQWRKTIEQANALLTRGPEFSPRAEILFTQALNSATTERAPNSEIERIDLSLARLYNTTSRPESAAKCLEQAVVLSKRQKDDPIRGQLYDELCKSYELRQDWKNALKSAREAVSLKTKKFGEASDDTEYSLSRLAEISLRMGDLDEAQTILGKDIAICRQLDPKQKSLPLAHAYENLALALAGMHEPGKNGDVEFNANRALNIYMEMLGKKHPCTKNLAAWFTKWLRESGLANDATAIEEKIGEVKSQNATLTTGPK